MKNNKFPGKNSILNEALKAGGSSLLQAIKQLFNKCLNNVETILYI